MINLRKAAAVSAAAIALALGALAAPASAAAQSTAAGSLPALTGASGGQIKLHEVTTPLDGAAAAAPSGVGALKDQSASPAFSTCSVSAFGYGGEAICGTEALTVYSGGVAKEAFVIGTNWAIWHAWPDSDGWHSLGGVAEHTTANGVYLLSSNPYVIWTYGTNGSPYCSNWGIPNWSSWYAC